MAPDDETTELRVVALDDAARPRPEHRRRRTQVLVTLALAVLALVALSGGAAFVWSENVADSVQRLPDVFGGIDGASRPVDSPVLNILLVGTDSRSNESTTGTDAAAAAEAGSQRSDVVMLMQLAADRRSASVVSIPRDSWVDIPGHGPARVNAAYAHGGPALLTETVEDLTGTRVDHFAVVDFAGFQAVVDIVGGIDVQVAEATSNAGVDFAAGPNHLDGTAALAYVRQRYDLPGGDLDRARRQQAVLRALLDRAVSDGTLNDPLRLLGLVAATSRSVSVDDTLSNNGLRALALESTSLRSSAVRFLSVPVAGFGFEGEQSVVYLDHERAADLWVALQEGDTGPYAEVNPGALLGDVPS